MPGSSGCVMTVVTSFCGESDVEPDMVTSGEIL